MGEIEKTKNTPIDPRRRRNERIVGVLMLVIGVCFLALMGISWTKITTPGPASVLYTLVVLVQPMLMPWMITLGVVALGVGCWAFLRRAEQGLIALTLLVSAVMCSCGWVTNLFPYTITPVQSLWHQDHLYRLLYTTQNSGSGDNVAYVVIECDSWGLACRYYATPFEGNWYNNFGDDGRLIVDETDQQLYLREGDTTYPMIRQCGWDAKENAC